MADQDRIPMLAGRGAPGKGRDRFKLGLLFLGLSVCLVKPAGAEQMPSVLGLKPGMTLAATEALLASMQPKLNQQSVMTRNPIVNGAPATMYIKASSSDAVGNTTIWLRFSLLDGGLETINYERDFANRLDYARKDTQQRQNTVSKDNRSAQQEHERRVAERRREEQLAEQRRIAALKAKDSGKT